MQANYLLAVILTVCANGDSHINIDFNFIYKFQSLKWDSGATESCVYDPVNGLFRFWDRNMSGEADSLPATYPFFRDGSFEQGREGSGNETSGDVAGTIFVSNDDGNFVYIADIMSGEIYQYNVDTEELGEELDTGKAGANGLCYDETNNMLYATNVGVNFTSNLPLPDTSNIVRFNLDDSMPTAETIYISGDALYDSANDIVKEAITGDNYTFRPNGCTITNGMAYFIETRPDGLGGLLKYDIKEDKFVLNTATPAYSGDGLITIGNYLIMSSWGNASDTGFLSYYDLDSYPDGGFTKLEDEDSSVLLKSPADIGVDPYGTICIPSLLSGEIYFYKFSAPGTNYRLLDKEFDFKEAADKSYAKSNGISYDPNTDGYTIIDALVSTNAYIADIHELDAQTTLNETDDSDFGYSGTEDASINRSSVIDGKYDDYDAPIWRGQVFTNGMLYILDQQGLLAQADIASERVTNAVELIDTYPDPYIYMNGLCVDPDNPTMLYAVDVAGRILSIDVSDDNVTFDDQGILLTNNWKVTEITNGSDILDQDGSNPRSIHPYDCTVSNGMIYIVDFGEFCCGDTGFLTYYDTENDNIWYNVDIFPYLGSAIASFGDILVAGIPGDGYGSGTSSVLVSIMNNDGSRSPFQVVTSGVDEIGVVQSIAIDSSNGVIVVNSFPSGQEDSIIRFIIMEDGDDVTSTTTQQPQPTQAPIVAESTKDDGTTDATNILSSMYTIVYGLILYLYL